MRVSEVPFQVALLDADGQVSSEQAAPVSWQAEGLTSTWRLAPDAQIYGLGDKAKGFDRRGQRFEFWNTDAYGWKPDADPLYKAIPFFLFLNHGQAHGMFFDTPARAEVDLGQADSHVLSYAAAAGDSLDVYLLAGPDPKRVVSAFSALTGRTPLPPLWALGYQQSRYSYLTEQEARSVATRLRADAIPSDALWLDIDYQLGNAPFTVDPAGLSQPPRDGGGSTARRPAHGADHRPAREIVPRQRHALRIRSLRQRGRAVTTSCTTHRAVSWKPKCGQERASFRSSRWRELDAGGANCIAISWPRAWLASGTT